MAKTTKAEKVNSQNIPLDAPPDLTKALTSLEVALGGRQAIADSLALADLSPEEGTVLNLLADPATANKPLAWVLGSAGITIGQLLKLFSKGDFAEAYVRAMRAVYRAIPDVAEDIMKNAVTRYKTCTSCEGGGRVTTRQQAFDPEGKPFVPPKFEDIIKRCLNCEGTGKVEQEADLERQKVALQMGGILKQGGGLTINQTNQTNNQTANFTIRSSADFRNATDRLLYPGRQKSLPEPSSEPANFIVDAEKVGEKVEDVRD